MSDYWLSTRSPPDMLARRAYETAEREAHLRANVGVCPSILSRDMGLCVQHVMAYQRHIGIRSLTGNGVRCPS